MLTLVHRAWLKVALIETFLRSFCSVSDRNKLVTVRVCSQKMTVVLTLTVAPRIFDQNWLSNRDEWRHETSGSFPWPKTDWSSAFTSRVSTRKIIIIVLKLNFCAKVTKINWNFQSQNFKISAVFETERPKIKWWKSSRHKLLVTYFTMFVYW